MREFNDDLLDQIIYRGEGNSSIVVALKDKSKVIRLLKKDGKIMKTSQDHCVTQHPMRSIKFIHTIMKPLTSPYLSDNTELVHLKSDFINLLSKKVEAKRPAHRLDKTLNLDDQYALVMDDLCSLPLSLTKDLQTSDFIGPTISVEIKPKQGFLLPYQRLTIMQPSCQNDKTVARLQNSCVYGLNQHFKLARARIEEMSNYCPLDLFSGCPIKMRAALQALLDNPQNNLRIFKDLILAYDEANRRPMSHFFDQNHNDEEFRQRHASAFEKQFNISREELIDLLIKCLLSESSDKPVAVSPEKSALFASSHASDDENMFCARSIGDQCTWHSSTPVCCDIYQRARDRKPVSSPPPSESIYQLPRLCVLACVLRAQRLDSIGPFEAKDMLEWLLADSNSNAGPNAGRQKAQDILEELSKPRLPKGFGARSQLAFESQRDYFFRKVWEFLVSLTAKDCSIIITTRQITQTAYEKLQNHTFRDNLMTDKRRGKFYVFHVGIADFDQKMPLKILRICENLNQIMLLMRNQENIPRLMMVRESSEKHQLERDIDHHITTK